MPDYLTADEAAAIAGVTSQSIYRAQKLGLLPCIELYGRKLVTRAALDLYVRSMGQRNGHKAKIGLQAPRRPRRPARLATPTHARQLLADADQS